MTDLTEMRKNVKDLVAKAAGATESGDAMRFSQAACNSANALAVVDELKTWPTPKE